MNERWSESEVSVPQMDDRVGPFSRVALSYLFSPVPSDQVSIPVLPGASTIPRDTS